MLQEKPSDAPNMHEQIPVYTTGDERQKSSLAQYRLRPPSKDEHDGQRTICKQIGLLYKNLVIVILLILLTFYDCISISKSTSINYGISQKPITDINQLMPALCQNQSVICEGSFCIPKVKKCVCDLRQPVAFDRFCLRQVDIETKCFATNQCNHTIKDAVCMDTSSQTVLDYESSKYKLEQWQHLKELRSQSQPSNGKPSQIITSTTTTSTTTNIPRSYFMADRSNADDNLVFESHDEVIVSALRNSPYEITTPELMTQNHTRRRQNPGPMPLNLSGIPSLLSPGYPSDPNQDITEATSGIMFSTPVPSTTTTQTEMTTISVVTTPPPRPTTTTSEPQTLPTSEAYTSTSATTNGKKKTVVKTPNWPPGVCSCPPGFMFDHMLRKCLGLSLTDAHCRSDDDCRQIRLTHCSEETKKCECDEPFVWNQTELSCNRPLKSEKDETSTVADLEPDTTPVVAGKPFITAIKKPGPPTKDHVASSKDGFLWNLLSPLLLSKLLPNQTILLLIFVILIIVATLIILRLTVKCFSSSNATLISPKSSKNKHNKNGPNGLPPRSPYATLKRPEYHNKHSQFTQATRGRILNYDFEQDSPTASARGTQSSQAYNCSATMHRAKHQSKSDYRTTTAIEKQTGGGTLSRLKMHRHTQNESSRADTDSGGFNELANMTTKPVSNQVIVQELNDNISISHLDGLEGVAEDGKSESGSLSANPGPPAPAANQPPPYMLASSSMKGQGSAIAAAAAAVANRRMQMAQKKGATTASSSDQQQSGKIVTNGGTPVFL